VEGKENRRLVEAGPEAGGLPSLELPGGTHRLRCVRLWLYIFETGSTGLCPQAGARAERGGSKPGRLVRYYQDTYGCPHLRAPGRYVPVSLCLW